MSKTYSVREVAAALGITQRGVVQRLNRNQLKGTKKLNQFGTAEWQVYATKEISMAVDALKNAGADPPLPQQQSFAPEAEESYEDAIDAEGVDVEQTVGKTDWIDLERKRLEILAETLVKPLTEQLAYQAAALREKELELVEKDRQLRLLPDFQKQAETRRLEAEAKELEVIALCKQIEAMKTQAEKQSQAIVRLSELEQEILPGMQRQLEYERTQKDQTLVEVIALQNAKEEAELAKSKLEESLQNEIARLREEKEDQAKAIETKFDALNLKLEELQKPQSSWWKKFLGVS